MTMQLLARAIFLTASFVAAQIIPGDGLDFGTNETLVNPNPVDWCSAGVSTDRLTDVATFRDNGETWTVYEDLTQLDGPFVFQSASGCQKVLRRYSEETFINNATYNPYLGLDIYDVATAPRDLLADKLLKDGEPEEELVRNIAPPQLSAEGQPPTSDVDYYGTVQSEDTFTVAYDGSNLNWWTYYDDNGLFSTARYQGHLGGWMPGVRIRGGNSTEDYWESLVFADVDSTQKFIIPSWYRLAHVQNGKLTEVKYGNSYIAFPPFSSDPAPEEYYKALLRFGNYWNAHLDDVSPLTLPDQSWADMPKFALGRELVVRPGGVSPKYGAFERAYAGSEYEGFQDVFTSSVIANLEWGRFTQAARVIDNYFTHYVSPTGRVNMRGPEVPQFGMTLWYLAKYAQYTGDAALLEKHRPKILATASNLLAMHATSLRLPPSDPAHGLIKGWAESDAALADANRTLFWQPYFANTALVARGLRALATLPLFRAHAPVWRRAAAAAEAVLPGSAPPYVPPLPGARATLREAFARAGDAAPERWPHRLYTELLHAAELPSELAHAVHDTMRAYGVTALGGVANVGTAVQNGSRDVLGFVAYGYAHSLLLLDRVDEFVLFLYAHRYHVHSRGGWVAGEVADVVGGTPLFCVPAQLTVPAVVRWMLVLEDPDEEVVYLGRGVPRAWLGTGEEIGVKGAPTRWGRVDFAIREFVDEGVVRAGVNFTGRVPERVEVKFRAPNGQTFSSFTVNGNRAGLTASEAISLRADGDTTSYLIEGKVRLARHG